MAFNTLLIGLATLASRLLGFARDVLLAAVLGTGPVADAFFVAIRLPNLVRRITGEGAWNSGFIPVSHRLKQSDGTDAVRRFTGEALIAIVILVSVLSVVVEIFAPQIVSLVASGLDEEARSFAILLTRLSFPLAAGALLGSFLAAVLASREHFGLAAFAPVIVNAMLVVTLLLAEVWSGGNQIFIGAFVSLMASFAGFLQVVILLPVVMTGPERPIWPRAIMSVNVRRMLSLAGPGLLAAALAQIAIIIAIEAASDWQGAVARLNYADRLFQLPLGLVATALGIVALPALTKLLLSGNKQTFHDAIDRAVELAFFLSFPAMTALLVIPEEIISVLFERGAFTSRDTLETAQALQGFAWGLPFAALARVEAQIFFAHERPRWPLLAAAFGLIVTFASAMLFGAENGLFAVASSVSLGAAATVLLQHMMVRHVGGWRLSPSLLFRLVRIGAAALIMGFVVRSIAQHSFGLVDEAGLLLRVIWLLAICLGGMVLFGALAWAFRVLDLKTLKA
jgi:putative peptidoglycan lipid II flippase